MAADGAQLFAVSGASYDHYMGRFARPLADLFGTAAGVRPGQTAIDVGCGPGTLTRVLAQRLGAGAVRACDPSPSLGQECRRRLPGVLVASGRAEAIPFQTGSADQVLAQLVLHFVTEPRLAVAEMVRVARPGGTMSACVWGFDHGMELLRAFWDAALSLDPEAPDEARTLRFGRAGELSELFSTGGLTDVEESSLQVSAAYTDFDELWQSLLLGVGPAGRYCVELAEPSQQRLRQALFDRLDRPAGPFTLGGLARCAVARTPSGTA